jgi:hypothetical protein
MDWRLGVVRNREGHAHGTRVQGGLVSARTLDSGRIFVQVDQTWKGDGQELHSLEILSYNPTKKIHTSSGFSSDGLTWALTATFDDATVMEEGVSKGPDGQVTTCHTNLGF